MQIDLARLQRRRRIGHARRIRLQIGLRLAVAAAVAVGELVERRHLRVEPSALDRHDEAGASRASSRAGSRRPASGCRSCGRRRSSRDTPGNSLSARTAAGLRRDRSDRAAARGLCMHARTRRTRCATRARWPAAGSQPSASTRAARDGALPRAHHSLEIRLRVFLQHEAPARRDRQSRCFAAEAYASADAYRSSIESRGSPDAIRSALVFGNGIIWPGSLAAVVGLRAGAQRPARIGRERHGHVRQPDAGDVVAVGIGLRDIGRIDRSVRRVVEHRRRDRPAG